MAHTDNKTKISLERTPLQTELEATRLKATNMRSKKHIEKEKGITSRY